MTRIERRTAPRRPREDRQFVTSLARGLEILRCFGREDRGLGNAEIAARSQLPKPTVSRLTHTLTQLGYLTYSAETQKYSLGVAVLSLGHAFLATMNIRDVARPLMQELADYARATVSLGAPDRQQMHMVYLEICEGANLTFHMRREIGSRVPHGVTAMGRAHLCALEPEQREALLEQYRALTRPDEWAPVRAGIDKALKDYQRYGFCLSLGDWNKEVWAVGVPMVSGDRSRILAFNCSGPVFEMTRARLIQDIGPRLVALRDRVRDATGGSF